MKSNLSRSEPAKAGAPDVTLPLRFLGFGLVCLGVATGVLVVQPELLTMYHYHQRVAAVVHLLLLGFVLSVVMGATYQLVPVALETRLHRERLARWHFPVHVVSVVGMVAMFWVWNMKDLGHFASGLALGTGFFAWNLGRTLMRVRGWTVISAGIAGSVVWLGLAVLLGMGVAAAKSTYEITGRPGLAEPLAVTLKALKATAEFFLQFEPLGLMHAHAHLGVLGIFLTLIVAVAYKLVPMFLISEVQRPARAWASLVLLNLGTVLVFLTVLEQSRWRPVAGGVVLGALGLYLWELKAIVEARRRLRLDWGIRTFLVAQGMMIPLGLLGIGLSWPGVTLTETVGRLENAYGFAGVYGVLALSILGMLSKIGPFLVWYAVYAGQVGRVRTPSLQEMQSATLQCWGLGLWLAGMAAALIGIGLASAWWARGGAAMLGLALAVYGANLARVMGHWIWPRTEATGRGRNAELITT